MGEQEADATVARLLQDRFDVLGEQALRLVGNEVDARTLVRLIAILHGRRVGGEQCEPSDFADGRLIHGANQIEVDDLLVANHFRHRDGVMHGWLVRVSRCGQIQLIEVAQRLDEHRQVFCGLILRGRLP